VWQLLLELFGPDLVVELIDAAPGLVRRVRSARMRRAMVHVANGHVLAIALSGLAASDGEVEVLVRALENVRPHESPGSAARLMRHWRRRWIAWRPGEASERVEQLLENHSRRERAALLAVFDELVLRRRDNDGHPYRAHSRQAEIEEIRRVLTR
jgi:hypothetical protein